MDIGVSSLIGHWAFGAWWYVGLGIKVKWLCVLGERMKMRGFVYSSLVCYFFIWSLGAGTISFVKLVSCIQLVWLSLCKVSWDQIEIDNSLTWRFNVLIITRLISSFSVHFMTLLIRIFSFPWANNQSSAWLGTIREWSRMCCCQSEPSWTFLSLGGWFGLMRIALVWEPVLWVI